MKTPYFTLNKQKLALNYRDFKQNCEKILGKNKFSIAFSVKTNSLPEVIQILANEGSGFEVASISELELVNKLSKDKNIKIFNSACKTQEELELALKKKYMINIDSLSEIDKIANLTKSKTVKAGLRISFNDSKFGINAESLSEAINYAKSEKINIIGLHFHQGTQLNIREYEQNILMLENMLERLKIKLDYIDLGGGIPDKQQLKNIGKTTEDYLNLIKNHISRFSGKIILEPGRALVSDTMELITQVQVIKENLGKKYAILDAGINFLPKITLSAYRFTKLNSPHKQDEIKINNKSEEYILAGPLLFSNDILGKFQSSLKEGDLIRVENVGAYCYNLSWTISYNKPKVVLI